MLVFVCEDQPESILTGVYEAWADPVPNRDIRLELFYNGQQELFCEYRAVKTDQGLAGRVADSILRKLGRRVWDLVESALLSDCADKAQAVFLFLRAAFSAGPGIVWELGRPEVMRIFELDRMVRRESRAMIEFIRFADAKNGILVAQIEPRHRQLSLVTPHFAERLNTERFVIYDRRRKEASVYSPDFGWYLTMGEAEGIETLIAESERDGYAGLWEAFFHAVAIKERYNPKCQRNLLPLRFRPYMTEFRRKQSGQKKDENIH